MAETGFLVRSAGFSCDNSCATTVAKRPALSAGRCHWSRVVRVVLAVLTSLLIVQGSAMEQSPYYDIGRYCNSSDACGFGDPVDLATGAFQSG